MTYDDAYGTSTLQTDGQTH